MSAENKCPNFGRCGGCNLINTPYHKQLELKKAYVNEQLKGYAVIDNVHGMEEPYHYRNKVHVVISKGKSDKRNKTKARQGGGEIVAGIYEEESHRVVPAADCLLHDSYANDIIKSIVDIMKKGRYEPYDEDRGTGGIRHILIRRGHKTNQTMVVIVTGTKVFPGSKNFVKELLKKHPDINTIVHNINDKRTSMVLGDAQKVLYGKGYIEDELCGCRFRISPKSFYQINSVQTEVLYGKAVEFAGLTGEETVLDAYCGIGTISMVASKASGKVLGVELNKDAVRDAVINAKINGADKEKTVKYICDDAGQFMEKCRENIDVVFMDPPRSGSDEKFLGSLIRLSPKKIVYISCNPVTQRRDLGYLKKGGYKVKKAAAVDMFPGTDVVHTETVVLLAKS